MRCVVCGRNLQKETSSYYGAKGPLCGEHYKVAKLYGKKKKKKSPWSWMDVLSRLFVR